MIKNYLNKATGNEKSAIQSYYEDLIQERNEILEHLTENEKNQIAKDLNFDTEETLKKEEEEKAKEATQYISINDVMTNAKIYKNQKLCETNQIWNGDLFQPIKKNLCPVDSNGRWSFPEGITSSDVEGWENIIWALQKQFLTLKIIKFSMKELKLMILYKVVLVIVISFLL